MKMKEDMFAMQRYSSMHMLVGRTARYLLLVACLGSGLFWSACKRYEEGPFLTVLSVEKRVTNTWKWSLAIEHDQNLTGVRADSTLTFEENGQVKVCGEAACREGSWNLVTKKEKLQLIFGQQATAYDILLLKRNEMWLAFTDPASGAITRWELVSD